MSGWNKLFPLASTSVSGSAHTDPTENVRDNWEALEDWWNVEHSTFTSGGSGTHTFGKFGVLITAANSAITALTSPGTGAIGYDTTNGQLLRYNGTSWVRLTSNKYSRIRQGFGTQTIPTTAWTTMSASSATVSGTYDTLGEWNATTFRFTATQAGTYFVKGAAKFPVTTDNYTKGVGIGKNGVLTTKSVLHGASIVTTEVNDILSLAAGDYIVLACYHEHTSSVDIVGGNIHIMRLS
jgi:hypothetical protein